MKKFAFLFGLLVVSANAVAQTWYVFDGVPEGKKYAKCSPSSSTPEKEMKEMEELNWGISFYDEVKDANGKVISLKIVEEIPNNPANRGGIVTMYWFRSKNACIEARNKYVQEKLNEERAYKEADRKKFAPYQ